jgi:Ca2+-binding EF-hand superfamily protein
MQNNCWDIERVYFELDKTRRGYFDRNDMKVYMLENGVKLHAGHEHEIDLVMNYFDRRQLGRVTFDEFVDEFM